MAAIHDLLAQVQDEALRERLQREIEKLEKTKKFGLVFEEHLPECTPLYDIPVRRGGKVALKAGPVSDFYEVLAIKDDKALVRKPGVDEVSELLVTDLVTIAEFGDPIYPFLKPVDTVCNAPDSNLWHALIEADNYHALQLLEYLYADKVDCIYIDPPYNTGAKDWKYNNDYVDGADAYRHSKWLSMMEKRLLLAKKILNHKSSVMIITIDEKEYLHLGCLLEELFSDARIQMVCNVINPHGANRKDMFARVEEYIFFVFIGEAAVIKGQNDMLHPVEKKMARWSGLMRQGASGRRTARPNQFYPIFFDKETGKYHSVGQSLPLSIKKEDVEVPEGCFAVFPINSNGEEAIWGLLPESFLEKLKKGYVKFGPWKKGSAYRSVSHLQDGMIEAIANGEVEILGTDEEGALITGESRKTIRPLTVWNQSQHSASEFGSSLLNKFFNELRFSFPKSLYAVHDTLKFIVKDNREALIVDFFAGSGTTLHAVNLLNAEDGGHRRCIMVTNNEVSEAEASALLKKGIKPGDQEWENRGIAQYVTWPRTVCSIEGHDITGNPLKGNYFGTDQPMADGFPANVAYFKLGFLDKTAVSLGMQFKEMLPLLWMKSGAVGPCPDLEESNPDMLILPRNQFAVLLNENMFSAFAEKLREAPEIQTVFLITDYEVNYRSMVKELQVQNTYQLYRDYLDNFRINHGRN